MKDADRTFTPELLKISKPEIFVTVGPGLLTTFLRSRQ